MLAQITKGDRLILYFERFSRPAFGAKPDNSFGVNSFLLDLEISQTSRIFAPRNQKERCSSG